MDRSIKAGIFGFLLVIIVNLFSPVYLDFAPSFLIALLAIYIFRLETLKDGLVAAFMTYIFSDGILETIAVASYYFASPRVSNVTVNIDVWTMVSPIVSAATAVIAGYVGVWLARKRKPAPEPPQSIPRELQSV